MSIRKTTILIGLVLGLSGFASLVYQILWVRYFSYLLGGTVISLSMVSAVFLGGLALGYRYLGRWGDRLTQPLKVYVGLEAGIAILSLLPMLSFNFLSGLVDPTFLALADLPAL
jgi:spermidine synthase